MLAEKVNVSGENRKEMTNQRKASACFKQAQEEYDKRFTLEFSRDRKSMSVYCLPKINRSSPLMFVKVHVFVQGGGEGGKIAMKGGREGGRTERKQREKEKDIMCILVVLTGRS